MLALSSRAISSTRLVAQVLADDVAAERQGQAGLLEPPLAEVDDLVQALVAVVELALVDDQAGVDLALGDGREDLVERHDRRPARPCPGRAGGSGRRSSACRGWRSSCRARSSSVAARG